MSDFASIRQLYTGDNLPILRCMNDNSVDLIYLDPPFNTGKRWENPIEAKGKKAMASFKDAWTPADIHIDDRYALGQLYPNTVPLIESLQIINGGSWWAYLIYMGVRLAEMRRILKPTGSLYYHCDPTMSHGVKLLMDAMFGKENFMNDIIWYYPGGLKNTKNCFPRKHDNILFYQKTKASSFNIQRKDITTDVSLWQRWGKYSSDGSTVKLKEIPLSDKINRERQIKKFTNQHGREPLSDDVLYQLEGAIVESVWNDCAAVYRKAERTGYPTQKPRVLLERIIAASSNEGDIVLDPFCGCATTCIAAERLNRQWIGIDLSEEAKNFVLARLKKDVEIPLADSNAVVEHLTNLPKRTDLPKITDKVGLKADLQKNQNNKCEGCRAETQIGGMQLDHIIPKAKGGQDVRANFQLLCGSCNSEKGARPMETLRKNIIARRIKEQEEKFRREWEERRRDD